jgi:hypothetical protein
MAKASFLQRDSLRMARPWIRPAIAEALDLPLRTVFAMLDNTPGTAVLKE